jgi:hypothetical protein
MKSVAPILMAIIDMSVVVLEMHNASIEAINTQVAHKKKKGVGVRMTILATHTVQWPCTIPTMTCWSFLM